ncbi:thiamine pyrophosphate-requiring protein [SAR202 cluster bacterium AD-804-J14_MRT_500m]|nr:thiamine pyrophosphate-requiring protein [SAR202 cluster bacterium AD-804-J14_MRT_500m]
MNVNQAVARILKIENVEWVSCFPSNQLIEEVAREGIRTLMFRQERGAIMAADGYSRLNNRDKFGVTITQGGPGSENSMGGIAQAFSDNVPILYIPGGPALGQYAVRPSFSPVRTYQTVSKFGEIIVKSDQVASVMRRAFHALRNGRPGPVIVEIPADVADMEIPNGSLEYQPPKRLRQKPISSDINDAVKLLLKAKKPMIWAGMGVLLSGASADLQELSELTEIPVYTTMPGKSSFDERHPLSLGAGSSATTLPARRWIQESDVIFAVGSSMTRTGYGQPIPDGKVIIHNTESIEDINKDFSVDVGLPGDAKLTLKSIIKTIKAQSNSKGPAHPGKVSAEIAALRNEWMAQWAPLLNSNEEPINTYRVIGELESTLDKENSIVTHDAGAPRDTIMPFYRASTPHSYIGWGKTTHLGYGIPLMIGAKLAKPDKFCLNFMGDGAFGMSGLDIETSVRGEAPITTIVLNNQGMATYPGGYPTAAGLFGTTQMTGDYAKIAEGMGAVGITVTKPSEVKIALKRAQQLNEEGKSVLLDIHTNLEARRSNFA